jgi:hypothetical protein
VLLTESHRGGSNPSLTANSYMKVCLLLSGGMRNATETFPSFKSNLLDRYDTDVFISTWNSHNVYNSINLFSPISFDVENYEAGFESKWNELVSHNEYKLETNANLVSMISMWYKTLRANQLKKKYENLMGVKYDLILKTRPDIILEEPIELIQSDSLAIPFGWDWSEGINDLMAWGNQSNMETYCELFYSFVSLSNSMDKINPETMLKEYLKIKNIKTERPKVDLTLRDMNIKTTYWFCK